MTWLPRQDRIVGPAMDHPPTDCAGIRGPIIESPIAVWTGVEHPPIAMVIGIFYFLKKKITLLLVNAKMVQSDSFFLNK